MNDLRLQQQESRYEYQRQVCGIRWSDAYRRWLVFDPQLIVEILKNPAFVVPSYDTQLLEERVGVDLRHTRCVSTTLPLALEGEAHAISREVYARRIAANSHVAMELFRVALIEQLSRLDEAEKPNTFCLLKDLFRLPIRKALLSLAGFVEFDGFLAIENLESIPQHFDDTTSVKRRVAIESLMAQISAAESEQLSEEEINFRSGLVLLGANTLLGSIVLSVVDTLRQQPDKSTSEIEWSGDLPSTSLPLIERICQSDIAIGGTHIKSDQRIRLFLESAGMRSAGISEFSNLFFAAGPHVCSGMNFSKQVWRNVVDTLRGTPRNWTLKEVHMRRPDHVFNFVERTLVVDNG